MLHPVIMAGGSGTRFWPRSRLHRPKQLIEIIGDGTMIQQTVARLQPAIRLDTILIITNAAQADAMRGQLPQLSPAQIVAEPVGRDTAAAIGLAALLVQRHDPDGTMAVLSADHVIRPAETFQRCLAEAARLAETHRALVTFGVVPSEPSPLYGYLHRGEAVSTDRPRAYRLRAFKEKPDTETARRFVDSGEFYWNSGNFVWRAEDILAAIRQFMPALYDGLERIRAALETDALDETLAREYPALERQSIDYGVMEKAANTLIVEAEFEWDDVGAWDAIARHHDSDADGNTLLCEHIALDTRNCIVAAGKGHMIATVGVENLIVVQTPDATLICDRSRTADVKEIVAQLKAQGKNHYIE